MFKVSRSFIADFAQLANFYGWTPVEIEEIKVVIRNEESGEMKRYLETLAAAQRNGYQQTKENNYVRLERWLWARGESL